MNLPSLCEECDKKLGVFSSKHLINEKVLCSDCYEKEKFRQEYINKYGKPKPKKVEAINEKDSEIEYVKPAKGSDEKYCLECGEIIRKNAEICPFCGVRQIEPPHFTQKQFNQTHGVPALMSFFIGGLGQLVKGHVSKAIGIWIATFILILIPIYGWIILLILWLWNVYDAYTSN